jgi:sucrose-6-phosphate hydrolase SacC (GH32 family)
MYSQKNIRPIGLTFINDRYYLFYGKRRQKGIFYTTSIDLINFGDEIEIPIDEECDTGSVLVKNKKIYLIYSTTKKSSIRLISMTLEGEVEVFPVPVINKIGLMHPKVFHDGNKYYLIASNRNGVMSVYESVSILSWVHCLDIDTFKPLSPTHPALQMTGDEWVLFFKTKDGFCYTKGGIDFEGKRYAFDTEIKCLDNLNSPRVNVIGDGRNILLGAIDDSLVMRELWTKVGNIVSLQLREIKSKCRVVGKQKLGKVWKREVSELSEENFQLHLTFPNGVKGEFTLELGDNPHDRAYLYFGNNIALLSVGDLIDKYSQRRLNDMDNLECDIYFIDGIVSVFLTNEGITLTQKLDISKIYDNKILLTCDDNVDIYYSEIDS